MSVDDAAGRSAGAVTVGDEADGAGGDGSGEGDVDGEGGATEAPAAGPVFHADPGAQRR